jgi:hypothetical protein
MDRVHRERHPGLFQTADATIRDASVVEALLCQKQGASVLRYLRKPLEP